MKEVANLLVKEKIVFFHSIIQPPGKGNLYSLCLDGVMPQTLLL